MGIVEFTSLESRFTFGRHKGLNLADVMDLDPQYLNWCITHIDEFLLHDDALEQIQIAYPEFHITPEFERCRQENYAAYYSEPEDTDSSSYEPDWCCEREEPTYERYCGTYAQDVAGYSDDDIDTIFDGEPDAYWNID